MNHLKSLTKELLQLWLRNSLISNATTFYILVSNKRMQPIIHIIFKNKPGLVYRILMRIIFQQPTSTYEQSHIPNEQYS